MALSDEFLDFLYGDGYEDPYWDDEYDRHSGYPIYDDNRSYAEWLQDR
jgi:hypothetical protein